MTQSLTSLPTNIQNKIISSLSPPDLLFLSSTCKSLRDVIMNDDLLVQLSLVDRYDNYAIDEKSKTLLDFEKIQETKAEECLIQTYPTLVANSVNFHKHHFPKFDVFIPKLPSSYYQLLLLIPLLWYVLPQTRPYSIFAPIFLFILYYTTIHTKFKPTIDILLHNDYVIRKTLQRLFLLHISSLLPLFLFPLLLIFSFIHPMLLLLWFFMFLIPLPQHQLTALTIGYIISIMPLILTPFELFNLNVEITTAISTCVPLVGYTILVSLNQPIEVNGNILDLIIGLFVGGAIGCIWLLSFVPLAMTISIICFSVIVCGLTYYKMK
ncbi:F-box domain containing membrane protein [Entamoeba marina]